MKYLKIFICLFLCKFLLVFFPLVLMSEESASTGVGTENQEKVSKIKLAKQWYLKGNTYCTIRNKDYTAAVECYRKAVQLNPSEIKYIIGMASAYRDDKKFNEAQKLLKEALIKFPQRKDQERLQWKLADVHYFWAGNLRRKRDYTGAITHYETAYKFGIVCGHRNTALFLYDMATIYSFLGQKQKALEYYEKALNMTHLIRNRSSEVTILNSIAVLYFELGQKHKALDTLEKVLSIVRAKGYRTGEAATMNNIGAVYSSLGHKREALKYYETALMIYRKVGKWDEKARTLKKIAHVWKYLGDKQKALQYFEEALKIRRVVGEQARRGNPPDKIKVTVSTITKKNALVHEEPLPFDHAGNRTREAAILNDIGNVYFDLGNKQKALEYYGKALMIKRAVNDLKGEAITLRDIGIVYSALGQKQKALDYYNKALSIKQKIGDRSGDSLHHKKEKQEKGSNIELALEWKRKGDAHYEKKEYIAALDCYQKAFDLNPEKIEYVYKLSSAYKSINRFSDGEIVLKKALKKFKDESDVKRIKKKLSEIYSSCARYLWNRNKYIEAIEYYEKTLFIKRELNERSSEERTLHRIGSVYYDLNQYDLAIKYFERALLIKREMKDRFGEVEILNEIGLAYKALNQYHRALEYYKHTLAICREIKYRRLEGGVLNNIGLVYHYLREYKRAIEYYEKALIIHREVRNCSNEGNTLDTPGSEYNRLNQHAKTLKSSWKGEPRLKLGFLKLGQQELEEEYLGQTLAACRKMKNLTWEANTLNNLGLAYWKISQYELAAVNNKMALDIYRELKDRPGEAGALHNLGFLFWQLSRHDMASVYISKALSIYRELNDRSGECRALNDLGLVHYDFGFHQYSIECYEKALAIQNEVKKYSWNGNTLSGLMNVWKTKNLHTLAIFYGKQSVNVVQETQKNIRKLEKNLRRSHLESCKPRYRRLANLLISEGRLSEAQQVLDMLKKQEYFDFIRKDRAAAVVLSTQVDYTQYEKQWLDKYNTIMEKLSGANSEYLVLKLKKNKNDTENKRMEELKLQLSKVQKAYKEFFVQFRDAFNQYEKNKKAMKEDIKNLEKKASALRDTLKYLDEKEGGTHAALHYLVYKGRISVILTTPSGQLVKQADIDEKKFNEMVMAYRNFMMDVGRGIHRIKPPNDRETILIRKIKSYEKHFYDVIFKAMEEELKKYGTTNLVVSLDGVLRYLPLGALWDGENYLMQRYRIAIITPFSLKNIKDKPIEEKRILALGASQGSQELPPLPNVKDEIRLIVKNEEKGYYGLIKGKAFIDDDFTRDTMIDQLKSDNYPLVHIASHFKFSPGDETKNHLLLGDGTTMKLSEIRRMGKLFNNVKLLVLSACQTGVGGNGEEIDGFGELAQQSGAKSVVASLWPVADESTKDLMLTFYGKLKEGKVTGKIEALRQAQLELAGLEDLLVKDKNQTDQSNRQKTEYSHPYYWGPFIMMGNWR